MFMYWMVIGRRRTVYILVDIAYLANRRLDLSALNAIANRTSRTDKHSMRDKTHMRKSSHVECSDNERNPQRPTLL